jgi:hypothetical protein
LFHTDKRTDTWRCNVFILQLCQNYLCFLTSLSPHGYKRTGRQIDMIMYCRSLVSQLRWRDYKFCYLPRRIRMHFLWILQWKETTGSTNWFMQGDSGGANISDCEKKVHTDTCLVSSGNRDRAVWIFKYESIGNGSKLKYITYSYFSINFHGMLKWQICYS